MYIRSASSRLAGVVVEPGEHEVVRRIGRLELDHVLEDGLGLACVVELVGAVRRHEVLQRELAVLLVLRVVRRHELVGRELVVLHGILEQLVVLGIALLARLPEVVVAVAQEEIRRRERGVVRVGVNRLLVELGRLLVVLLSDRPALAAL